MVVNKEQLIRQVQAEFKNQFKSEPKLITLTPGRINIIGEHTDYNEGLAMPVAIDRWICGAICKSSNKSSTIYSLNYNDKIVIMIITIIMIVMIIIMIMTMIIIIIMIIIMIIV